MSTTTFAHPAFPNLVHVADPDAPLVLRASDHRPAPVKWLWPGRIPLGSITLLAGDPGSGKSLFALDLAARVSTAAPFPDELPTACGLAPHQPDSAPPPPIPAGVFATNPQSAIQNPKSPPSVLRAPCSVLLLSATDQFHDTILPRLAAAGADQDRVYVLDNLTNLRTEMEKLRATIDGLPDLKLLIIDPINFYVGPGDAHFQTVVRSVLQPLAALARQRHFAILAITHFRKNDGAALQRAAGSMGFVATARSIWTITTDPEDESRRYLVPLKNNLTAPKSALSFQIADGEMTKDECPMTNRSTGDPNIVIRHSEIRHSPVAPFLHWEPAPAACGLALPARKPRPATLRHEAQRFLAQALANGPRRASELFDEADARGLPRRTVQRAFHELAGHTTKQGLRGGWWWSLGEYPIAPIPDRPCDNPCLEPTYASDVAAQIGDARITADVNTRLAAAYAASYAADNDPAPTPSLSPSQKPRKKPRSTPHTPLSPSANLSPSTPRRRTPNPRPKKTSPLRAFMQHLSRPRREPPRPCTEPPHQEPDHP